MSMLTAIPSLHLAFAVDFSLTSFSLSLRERVGVRVWPLDAAGIETLEDPHPALSRRERVLRSP